MFEQIKELPSKAINAFRASRNQNDARSSLQQVENALRREWIDGLAFATGSPCLDPEINESVHVAIENLTECHTAIRRLHKSEQSVSPELAADVIATQLSNTKRLIQSNKTAGDRARNIATKTWNLLFAADQEIQSSFGVKGRTNNSTPAGSITNQFAESKTFRPVMQLSSAMIFQLRQSLFPAERMIVGAGRRSDGVVNIDALFDVTGVAGPGGVKADPNLLGQALIAMSQSGTYFAIWIHSHPGSGPGATHPSSIDLKQHADWLKNYSPDLVSAIMVADRYFRFWGTALEAGTISISIAGDGVAPVSAREHIYKLEV
jgi:hypothetical protein